MILHPIYAWKITDGWDVGYYVLLKSNALLFRWSRESADQENDPAFSDWNLREDAVGKEATHTVGSVVIRLRKLNFTVIKEWDFR